MPRTFCDWANVEDAAQELAGNHRKFDSFAWWERPDDGDRWALVYTHHRDSGLLDQSNADELANELEKFTEGDAPDVVSERHSHWAVGWIDGYAIRVFDSNDEITEAFRTYCMLQERMSDYPVLDEEDYSRREYEATLENIESAGRRFLADEIPEDWAGQCFSWFSDHNQRAVENRDDQGGYPDDEEMKEALDALGFLHEDYRDEEE
jgi:hypothetical protein